MNPDDFEKRLQRQPLREIPSDWREKILKGATLRGHASSVTGHSPRSTLTSRLSTLFWPHPKAWAGLAGLWVVIVVVHFASTDSFPQVAKKSEPTSAETLVVLRQQQRLLVELVGPEATKDIDRPKHDSTQPRSDRRLEILFV